MRRHLHPHPREPFNQHNHGKKRRKHLTSTTLRQAQALERVTAEQLSQAQKGPLKVSQLREPRSRWTLNCMHTYHKHPRPTRIYPPKKQGQGPLTAPVFFGQFCRLQVERPAVLSFIHPGSPPPREDSSGTRRCRQPGSTTWERRVRKAAFSSQGPDECKKRAARNTAQPGSGS